MHERERCVQDKESAREKDGEIEMAKIATCVFKGKKFI